MAWKDPLDFAPQVPSDWGSHVVYGGALGVVIIGALTCIDVTHPAAYSALAVLTVAALKKTVDFILEGETWAVCLGKTLATAAWPTTIALFAGLT